MAAAHRQTREIGIGIRLALGAAPGRILVWVLCRAMWIVASGVLLGVGASLIAVLSPFYARRIG